MISNTILFCPSNFAFFKGFPFHLHKPQSSRHLAFCLHWGHLETLTHASWCTSYLLNWFPEQFICTKRSSYLELCFAWAYCCTVWRDWLLSGHVHRVWQSNGENMCHQGTPFFQRTWKIPSSTSNKPFIGSASHRCSSSWSKNWNLHSPPVPYPCSLTCLKYFLFVALQSNLASKRGLWESMRHLFLKPEICFTSLVAQLCRLAVLSGEYFTPLDAILHQIFRFLAKAYIFF